MNNKLAFLILIVISSLNCSRVSNYTRIKGRIINPAEKVIIIGDSSVSLSENGEFNTVLNIESPALYLVSYSGTYCELIIYDNVGHLFTPSTMPDYNDPQPDPDIMKKASEKADEFLFKLGYIK